MPLNPDLFGKIPVTSEKSRAVPSSNSTPTPSEGGMWVSHGSKEPPEEFLKAPLIHVGSEDQAAHVINPNWRDKMGDDGYPLYDQAGDVEGVHGMRLSKHAKVHPITFPDDIANEAHRHFLSDMGMDASLGVQYSSSYHGKDHPLVSRALGALKSNKIVRYSNTWESPDHDWSSYDNMSDAKADTYSYIVPSPSLNLVQFGQKDPQKQRMLPMDYTGVMPESKTTKYLKSDGDLQMAARNHLSPHQYKLFMTGDEIKGLVSDSVDRAGEYQDVDPETGNEFTTPEQTMDELWQDKKNKGLKDTIAKEGVRRHVTIVPEQDGTFTMGQGHHRVQAASDLAKEGKTVYVPVVYDTDFNYSGTQGDDYERSYPHAAKEKF